jgi:hypothetical protein
MRHCEKRNDEAIQQRRGLMDCFALLAFDGWRVVSSRHHPEKVGYFRVGLITPPKKQAR